MMRRILRSSPLVARSLYEAERRRRIAAETARDEARLLVKTERNLAAVRTQPKKIKPKPRRKTHPDKDLFICSECLNHFAWEAHVCREPDYCDCSNAHIVTTNQKG